MDIVKFGGLFEESPEALDRLAGIVGRSGDVVVVVSAFPGVSDDLAEAARLAQKKGGYLAILDSLYGRHRKAVLSFQSQAEAGGNSAARH